MRMIVERELVEKVLRSLRAAESTIDSSGIRWPAVRECVSYAMSELERPLSELKKELEAELESGTAKKGD